ncbi:hypothetical protein H0H93_002110 [Arthromyces matolae]|nr:hypothetical protein H0H93_002110 [Arthromyces matolae]
MKANLPLGILCAQILLTLIVGGTPIQTVSLNPQTSHESQDDSSVDPSLIQQNHNGDRAGTPHSELVAPPPLASHPRGREPTRPRSGSYTRLRPTSVVWTNHHLNADEKTELEKVRADLPDILKNINIRNPNPTPAEASSLLPNRLKAMKLSQRRVELETEGLTWEEYLEYRPRLVPWVRLLEEQVLKPAGNQELIRAAEGHLISVMDLDERFTKDHKDDPHLGNIFSVQRVVPKPIIGRPKWIRLDIASLS